MGAGYVANLKIGRQEDGLCRVEVPDFRGCWVDAPTLAEALADIQEVIAMSIDYSKEQGLELPSSITPLADGPASAQMPVIVSEFVFRRPQAKRPREKTSAG